MFLRALCVDITSEYTDCAHKCALFLRMRYISTKLVPHLGRRKLLAATLAKSGLSAAPMSVGGGPTGGRVAGAATCSPEDVTGLATNSPTRGGED